MILIDTNIISEMMKQSPSERVIAWLDQQNIMTLFTSTITVAEISYGLNVLPKGNRRTHLEEAFEKTINEVFDCRLLTFDEKAAYIYGKIMGCRKTLGQPLSLPDGQIAAIAVANNLAVATRNVRDFAHCELNIMNPFNITAGGSPKP